MGKIAVSVCYIVKNEEKTLSVSLDSVQAVADEIVVIDTGSTDKTKTIAQSYGAKVYDYNWQDDFAAARNFALDKLSGDWVIFLDADEYFSEETRKNLGMVIPQQEPSVNLLLIQRQDVDETGKVMLSLYVPRIFRRKADLRYEGAIHEELRQNGELVTGIATIPPETLTLMHTGYAGAQGTAKAQRNLKILLQEVAKAEEPGRYYGYLAETYDGLGDRENAMQYAYMDIRRGRQMETYASRSYRLLLAKLSEKKRDYRERQRVAQMALKDYPELPEFHAEYAESLAAGWEYRKAADEMAKAISVGLNYQGLEPTVFDTAMGKLWQKRQRYFETLDKTAQQMKITACVIAKNEAANISRWLENAQVYADECIVLDTGSTDDTGKLAEKGGAKVYSYTWQDDFAAARNEALKYVQGDWIAFLDADEYFERPIEVRGALAECEHSYPQTEAVRLTICNVDADDGLREISRFCNIRLFRNRPYLRYRGRIHENLENTSGQVMNFWEVPELKVMHTGYSTGLIQSKNQRNLDLLQKDIAEHGEKPWHYRYLADCYYSLGDYKQAQFYALQAIASPVKGLGTQSNMYYMVLNCMKDLQEPANEQMDFAQAASRVFPNLPDFWAVQGMLYQEYGQYEQGERYLAKALHLARNSDGKEASAFGDIEALVYAKLADCEAYLGRREASLEHSSMAMSINPYEEQVLEVFCKLRQNENDALRQALSGYFTDTEQDLSFLRRFCERNGFGTLYAYYSGQLKNIYGKQSPRQAYYHLLQTGDWSALVDKLQAGLAENLDQTINLLLRLQRKTGKNYREAERQLIALMPAEMQSCWQGAFQGERAVEWSTYKILWPYILRYGDDEQISDYAQLALGEREIWPILTADMMREEKWQSALAVLASISQEEADGAFWLALGRCLYHLGELAAAKEALLKARQTGLDTLLLKSYERWLEHCI
ncbi:glycosyltransferase family 2 protein [Selenomonas ruminantium]|uniref:Tetratricopeptide repeat-containing protein n=1 Tax=Selenomonas ruminantium TaxID=971 RepID=A0A1H3ZI30_SELRU|nr:glycosyltransferase family 2 protein [Selenomonas ruminantium]SEA22972.1 Tetratricopeptide repeat-containing protein [Selenomonas ruminantium]